jgi:hypothetical protein
MRPSQASPSARCALVAQWADDADRCNRGTQGSFSSACRAGDVAWIDHDTGGVGKETCRRGALAPYAGLMAPQGVARRGQTEGRLDDLIGYGGQLISSLPVADLLGWPASANSACTCCLFALTLGLPQTASVRRCSASGAPHQPDDESSSGPGLG